MPLDDLADVIETLQARIEAHRQGLEANETRTRMALIDPLLQALGWDTGDPSVVTPEYESSGGRADYALLGDAENPKAIVEAKKLGEPLANHLSQMVTYANMSGIPYAGLTDGDHWEFYKVFEPKPLDKRRLFRVSIKNDLAHECAAKLLPLCRSDLMSDQPTMADIVVPSEPQPPRSTPEPSPPSPPHPAAPPSPDGWVALTELEVPEHPHGLAPSAMRFADQPQVSIRSWISLLLESVNWLYSQSLLSQSDCPIWLGTTRYLLNDRPVHSNGQAFKNDFALSGSNIHVEISLTAKQAVANAIRLLKRFDQAPAQVYVRVKA